MRKFWVILCCLNMGVQIPVGDIQAKALHTSSFDLSQHPREVATLEAFQDDTTLSLEQLLNTTIILPNIRGLPRAERMPVPAEMQVRLILKILTFDRNFGNKIGSELKIGIVYDPQYSRSRQARDAITHMLDQFATKTIKKRPITYIPLERTTACAEQEIIETLGINVLYIAPGNAAYLQELLKISRTHQITTVTGVPDYVKEGVAVGIGLQENRKPRILINLPSSKAEGSAFDANLLRLATVVK